MYVSLVRLVACLALVATLPLVAGAAGPRTVKAPPADAVDLFDAMEAGDLDVKLIPKDSTESTLMVVNKTDKPLTIKMPDALAAVPVAAQFGGCMGGGMCGGMGGGGMGGGGMQGMMGGMGGGMGGMGMGGMGMGGGMGGMGMGGGGGFFNVAPERVAKVKLVTVCLDHGKKDPNPRTPYKIIPVDAYAKNEAVIELGKMLVRGEIDQHSAQAAVWHLQNGLSWPELAAKIGVKHLDGRTEPYFRPVHLQRAVVATRMAEIRAEKSKESPGQSVGDELAQKQ